MPGCIVSATTASFRSVEKRRRRATPVITSTFENMSDIGVCLGLYLGPPAKAGVRSKRGAVHGAIAADFATIGYMLGASRLRLKAAPHITPDIGFPWVNQCINAASVGRR